MMCGHPFGALFDVPGYRVKRLLPEDTAALQALLERSSDYSQLVTGSPPAPSDAHSLLTDCPEGKTSDDKLIIGIFNERLDLIGVLDVIRDHPARHDWWVGLFLFDPEYRGRGLGSRVFQAFESWANGQGARRICLGVVEQNQAAYQFWRALGFESVQRRETRQFRNVEHVVIVMARALANCSSKMIEPKSTARRYNK